jgi:hypothetical protein
VNYGISVYKVSFKVETGYLAARYYYNIYKNDPEKKLQCHYRNLKVIKKIFTKAQITQVIKHIVDE